MFHRHSVGPASLALAMTIVFSLAGCQPPSAAVPGPPPSVSGEEPAADPAIERELASLAEGDRTQAKSQKRCPVSGEPLGSMGVPVKVPVRETSVFICCESCRDKLLADPDTYLRKLGQ